MVSVDILQRQLERLDKIEGLSLHDILYSRKSNGMNDVMMAYYSYMMDESGEKTSSAIDKLCIALDIVLRNQEMPLEHRQVVIMHLREICQDEPELVGLQNTNQFHGSSTKG